MLKKLLTTTILCSILLASLFFPLAKTTHAYDPDDAAWYYQDFFSWYRKVFDTSNKDEIFGERYTAAQIEWINYSLISYIINHFGNKDINWCLINAAIAATPEGGIFPSFRDMLTQIGQSFTAAEECIRALDDIVEVASNLLRLVDNSIGTFQYASAGTDQKWYSVFINRDISTVGYLRKIGQKFDLVPEVYAQGFGYQAGSFVRSLWSTVRDFSYFFIVLGALYMAFLIMFRKKLSPQAAVTVQSALPKIIITLVLITFSYAIAGFLIDLMYVVIGLISAILTTPGTNLTSFDWSKMFEALTQKSSVLLLFFYWLNWIVAAFFGVWFLKGYFVFNVVAAFLAIIAWFILIVVLVLVSFKLWWLLIKTYINILLKIAFSPIFIVGGLFGIGGFGAWALSLASDLAVYPIVGLMMFFAFVFLAPGIPNWWPDGFNVFDINSDLFSGGAEWAPPLTLGSGAVEILFVFASLSIITLTPKVADIIKSIMTRQPFAYGTAIGEALAPYRATWDTAKGTIKAGYQGYRSFRIEEIANQMTDAQATNFWGRLGQKIKATQPGRTQDMIRGMAEYLKRK